MLGTPGTKSEVRTTSNYRNPNDQNSVERLRIRIWNLSRISDFHKVVLGDVAQLGERRLCKPEVAGSTPVVSIVGPGSVVTSTSPTESEL